MVSTHILFSANASTAEDQASQSDEPLRRLTSLKSGMPNLASGISKTLLALISWQRKLVLPQRALCEC